MGGSLFISRWWHACAHRIQGHRWLGHAAALASYLAVTLAFSWPLPARLATALTGSPTGDTGVYVWNLWVFQRELLEQGHFPFFTSAIFSLTPRVDLALHNYTAFSGLLGVPLVPFFGVVVAFNLIYLTLVVLTAYAMYLLARDVAGDGPCAWLGGLLLAFSPALVARGTAHFSLVAAAPLPIFVLLLRKTERSGRRRHMVALGLTMAWAAYCDPYYGVYCLMLGLWHMGASSVSLSLVPSHPPAAPRRHLFVTVWLAVSVAVVVLIAATGGADWRVGPLRIGMRTLYTPMLSVTLAALAKYMLWYRLVPSWHPTAGFRTLLRLAPYGAATALIALSPPIVLSVLRALDGRFVTAGVLWRTSTPGVDALSFFLPNPNHPIVRPWLANWLAAQDGGFVENVASVPLVAILVIAAAGLVRRDRANWYWFGLAGLSASCALGPFLRVAGFNLFVPTPWALLRYVPVIGEARAPARLTVIVMLAIAVLFALALRSLGRRFPRQRPVLVTAVALVLLLELLPAPRPLYSAEIPHVYDVIREDTRDVRVLELPFGVRDGLSSFGDFNASAQFFQTWHGKPLMGGYLSRVSPKRVESVRRYPVLNALMLLSEGALLPPDLAAAAEARAERFIREARVGYVVVRRLRASQALVDFAVTTLDLELVAESETRTLYRPRQSSSRNWLADAAAPSARQ